MKGHLFGTAHQMRPKYRNGRNAWTYFWNVSNKASINLLSIVAMLLT